MPARRFVLAVSDSFIPQTYPFREADLVVSFFRRSGQAQGHTGRGSINTGLSLDERLYQFEWDEAKAAGNLFKHGISFELASTIFADPELLTAADLEHSAVEDRWFWIGFGGGRKLVFLPNYLS